MKLNKEILSEMIKEVVEEGKLTSPRKDWENAMDDIGIQYYKDGSEKLTKRGKKLIIETDAEYGEYKVNPSDRELRSNYELKSITQEQFDELIRAYKLRFVEEGHGDSTKFMKQRKAKNKAKHKRQELKRLGTEELVDITFDMKLVVPYVQDADGLMKGDSAFDENMVDAIMDEQDEQDEQ